MHRPVVSKKYIISLIVESNSSSPSEFWIKMKYGCQHAAYSQTQTSGEIIQNHLRSVMGYSFVISLQPKKEN